MKKNTSNQAPAVHIFVLLHDIRSIHNVGSIFRTADAFGVDKIYMSGYTPEPVDRFGRERADLSKVALGAEKTVPWEHVADPHQLIENFKKEGMNIIALEQAGTSVDYRDIILKEKNLIIFGNEVDGVAAPMLSLSDVIVEIPMRGQKESLNVSVAAGIFLFSLRE